MRKSVILTLILSFSIFIACDDDTSSGETIELSEVRSEYMNLMCEKVLECNTNPFISALGSVDNCLEFIDSNGTESFDMIIEAAEEGRIIYNGSKAVKCLSDMADLGCVEMDAITPESCAGVFIGTLENGEDCSISDECASGYCNIEHQCPGVCEDGSVEGESCVTNAQCDENTRCINGVCTVFEEELKLDDECDSTNDWCAWDLYCDYYSDTCQPRGDVDAECEYENQCLHGLSCNLPDGATIGTCVEIEFLSNIGDVCDISGTNMCNLFEGITCQINDFQELTGTCQLFVHEGDTCFDLANTTMTTCDVFEDLYCYMPDGYAGDGTCAPKKAAGQDCEDDDECLGYCSTADNKCAEENVEMCF
ncbi:MAG: hypothetical protein JXR95_01415 [Deltaproteobacteria bacterium]|nr:hypothetical protein [Deltaproteobacteria bacterium]